MDNARIAVIGTGISGLAAAWLLAQRHQVVLYDREHRTGGHSNTVDAPLVEPDGTRQSIPVDTGFIVYNTACYPNLIALFDKLDVPTASTSMSFGVSLDGGGYEYSGSGLSGLFAQRRNIASPAHWRMVSDIFRFFRCAEQDRGDPALETQSLGGYLRARGFGHAFTERHILPMAAAIWSTPYNDVLAFPAASFVRFFANHGMLQIQNRPAWRTVRGGSREYVARMLDAIGGEVRTGDAVVAVERGNGSRHDASAGVTVRTRSGHVDHFDDVVIASHADEALAMLRDADEAEHALLSRFRYVPNRAVLHTDAAQMPRRSATWSSWNYVTRQGDKGRELSLTYWMNSLQPLATKRDVFVTLNPTAPIAAGQELAAFDYMHPLFDAAAMAAQKQLWSLQGRRRTWFCGSYFGYGFHEDGAESGLAVAEQLGGLARPWSVPKGSSRIHVDRSIASPIVLDRPMVAPSDLDVAAILPEVSAGSSPVVVPAADAAQHQTVRPDAG